MTTPETQASPPEYGGSTGFASLADAPDGVYRVRTFSGDDMRAEKRDGVWSWSDGTGWNAKVECTDEIVHAIDISALPSIQPDFDYGEVGYPLNQFFPSNK